MATLLVVDDDINIRETLCAFFAETHECHSADRAEQALAFLEFENYDVILTDFAIPGTDGQQPLKRVKQPPGHARHHHVGQQHRRRRTVVHRPGRFRLPNQTVSTRRRRSCGQSRISKQGVFDRYALRISECQCGSGFECS